MNAAAPLRLTFYGDDFTGSTDVLEALSLAGVRAVLFLAPPSVNDVARFPAAAAVGVAGIARALPTAAMASELRPAFAALAALPSQFFHYKLCSTFDSSPATGSIGRALELALEYWPAPWVPLIVGAPALRRYVVFGNLFAHFEGATVRLDRHPTMSRHPVTPMAEADLRRHLAAQTSLPIAHLDWLALQQGTAALRVALASQLPAGSRPAAVVCDTLAPHDLSTLGALLGEEAGPAPARLVFGSSGVEHALVAHWRQSADLSEKPAVATAPTVDRLVVMSGSAAPQTAVQLADARARGWTFLRLDAPRLAAPDTTEREHARLLAAALDALRAGRSVVLFSAEGPEDPALAAGRGLDAPLGAAQGRLLRDLLLASGVRRACVTGGDTSGRVARALGIYALEFAAPLAPGGPLCLARAQDPAFDGLEIALKGGQVGRPDYLERVRQPSLLPSYP
jgi:uncharacterized protein YgbK (DUF1537 family)